MQAWLIILIVVVVLALILILIYNHLIKLNQRVRNSKGAIDAYLQQRFDTIPNLLEATKGYTNYERGVLERIAELRTSYKDDMSKANELNAHFGKILATAESYPDLKANQSFLHLQQTLVKMESQLQAARRIYNNDVTKLNTAISVFPNNIVASMFGIKKAELFAGSAGDENVSVKFD